jgi:predicted transposase YdaD
MKGGVFYATGDGRGKMDFKYELIRLWEIPATELLESGIGAATLAVLGKLPQRRGLESEIIDVLRELNRRLRTEMQPVDAKDLMASATVLTGLRIPKETAKALVERVQTMEESTVYQVILEKGEARGEARGRVEGARQALLAAARQALGRPPKKALSEIEKIDDVDRLVRMNIAVRDLSSWNELLAIE